jgi:hypothetical protein
LPMSEPADMPICVYPVRLEGDTVVIGIDKEQP